MSKDNKVFQYLDEPFRLVNLTFDELIVFLVGMINTIIHFNIIGIVIGILVCYLIKKLKNKVGGDLFSGLFYWCLPPLHKFKVLPPSHIREYIG